jgi:hypothetical protein
MRLRLVIAEDSHLIREGLRLQLEDAGHLPWLDDPVHVAGRTMDFLLRDGAVSDSSGNATSPLPDRPRGPAYSPGPGSPPSRRRRTAATRAEGSSTVTVRPG